METITCPSCGEENALTQAFDELPECWACGFEFDDAEDEGEPDDDDD